MISVAIVTAGIRLRGVGDPVAPEIVGVGAPHPPQNFVVAGLDRQIHMLADRREFGHRVDDLVRHVLRMRGQKAQAVETPGSRRRPQQVRPDPRRRRADRGRRR